MMTPSAVDTNGVDELISRARDGDREALAALFAHYRSRLKRMVQLRMDRRLQGRIDSSDVLQEAYLDVANRADEYFETPPMPFYIWLRFLTGQRLMALHRFHLGAKLRSANNEISLLRGSIPQASSISLAAQLLGQFTSPTQAAVRAELQLRLQEALNQMPELDREIIALRHFEELSNQEVSHALEIKKSAASNRYIRAMKKLKEILRELPGFEDI